MAKKSEKSLISKILSLVVWLTGVIVSLAVGTALIDGTLTVKFLENVNYVLPTAGWIVITTTLASVVLAILDKLDN